MKTYHTSNVEIRTPDIYHSRKYLDFGQGFYMTVLRRQAENYGKRLSKRGEQPVLNIYEFTLPNEGFSHKVFLAYDGEWLDYITACRKNLPHEKYDIIEGGIADDDVFDTIDLYLTGTYTREQALSQLQYKKPNHQLCITSQQVLEQCLRFIESVNL